ncbi:hypothetical protein Btru_040834 [Bulinus truncatus]|nr:hypothetical protein Btru_040834 [Bulinus truncatus]
MSSMQVTTAETNFPNTTACHVTPDNSRLTYVWMTWVLAGTLVALLAVTVFLLVRSHCGRFRHICGSMKTRKRVNTYEDVRSLHSIEACSARLKDTNCNKFAVTITDSVYKKTVDVGDHYNNVDDFRFGRCPIDDHQQFMSSCVDRNDHDAASLDHVSAMITEKQSHRRKRSNQSRRQRKRRQTSEKSHPQEKSFDSHLYSNLSNLALSSNSCDTTSAILLESTELSTQEPESECKSAESQTDLITQVGETVISTTVSPEAVITEQAIVRNEMNIKGDNSHPTFQTDSLLDNANTESQPIERFIEIQERDAIEKRHKEFVRSSPLSLFLVTHCDNVTNIDDFPFIDELSV